MRTATKQAIEAYIRQFDPEGELVSVSPSPDYSTGTVRFGNDIVQHRRETVLGAEKWVEAYLVVRLVRELDYPADCIELQKEYPAGHPTTTKPRIDIVVKDRRGSAASTFMLIEAKRPSRFEAEREGIEGQLFGLGDHERPHGLRYLVYFTVDLDGELEEKSEVIDANRFPTFSHWDSSGRVALDRLPRGYASARKSVFVNKRPGDLAPGERTLSTSLTREELSALRRELHNVLWGGGGTPDNDVFNALVRLFLAKIYDEEFTAEGEPYSFQIEFEDGDPEPATQVVAKLNSTQRNAAGQFAGLLRRAQAEYLEMSDNEILASQGLDVEKVSPGKIAYVVEKLQAISLTENEAAGEGDLLGEFFEGIARSGFKQSKGQFFTHPNIVKFAIYGLKLEELTETKVRTENSLPTIVDPACGSGTFLIEAMRIVTATLSEPTFQKRLHRRAKQMIESWTPALKQNIWAKDYIYGVEISPDLGLATKVNMVLHGDGNINVFVRDGLLPFARFNLSKKVSTLGLENRFPASEYAYPRNEQFDVIITNPPFSVDLDSETKRTLRDRFLHATKRNSENLFVERWYQLLRPGGRVAAVLPESVFDTAENSYIREFLLKHFYIHAVVSLPGEAFKPWTPTRTAILFATKKPESAVANWGGCWRAAEKRFRKLAKSPALAYIASGEKLLGVARRALSDAGRLLTVGATAPETLEYARKQLSGVDGPEAAAVVDRLQKWLAINPDAEWRAPDVAAALESLLRSADVDEGLGAASLLTFHWADAAEVLGSNWWIAQEVASSNDYEIHYFRADGVGYRRTTRKEYPAPNDLFGSLDAEGLEDQDYILGQLRSMIDYA